MLLPPYWQQEGGELHGFFRFSYCHYYGWCNLPLHHQMGWTVIYSQNEPVDLSPPPKKGIENPRVAALGVFDVNSQITWTIHFSLPIGIIAYAI